MKHADGEAIAHIYLMIWRTERAKAESPTIS